MILSQSTHYIMELKIEEDSLALELVDNWELCIKILEYADA